MFAKSAFNKSVFIVTAWQSLTSRPTGNSNVYNNFNEPVKIQDVKKGDAKNPMEGYLAANRDAKV